MDAALADVAPKIALLIPRLASDSDGEVVATVRAIRRQLASVGLDLHDLAQAVGPKKKLEPELPETWSDLTWWIMTRPGSFDALNDRERTFIRDMYQQFERGFAPSDKQSRWLVKIYHRLGGPRIDWAAPFERH